MRYLWAVKDLTEFMRAQGKVSSSTSRVLSLDLWRQSSTASHESLAMATVFIDH